MGFIVLAAGILYDKYPKEGRFLKLKSVTKLETMADLRFIRPLIWFFVRKGNGRLCMFTRKILEKTEADISINAFFLLKIVSLVVAAVIVISIRYTNIGVMTTSIISRYQNSQALSPALFGLQSYSLAMDSRAFYNSVLKSVGKSYLKKLDDEKKVEAALRVLPDIVKSNDGRLLQEMAASFVSTYNAVSKLKLLDWKSLMIIIGAFWIPEMVLVLRHILRGSMYKREVIKLENIFELLGSINGFRTIDILKEMSEVPGIYRKHLRRCMELFKTERELALEALKRSAGNSRFSRLVDVMRIYSLVDKKLAVQILERNRLEKEEEVFLTAEEDLDVIDIAAFASIVPILLELANLLMKPMLDMIYEAFRFV